MKIGQFNNEISSNKRREPTSDPFLSRKSSSCSSLIETSQGGAGAQEKYSPLYSGISRNINLFYPRAHKDAPVFQTLVCKVFLAADDKRKLNIRRL